MKFILIFLLVMNCLSTDAQKKRARDYGIIIGILNPGRNNAITDVPGVKVGHFTLIQGDSINTGVTVIIPHSGNIFQSKVPAAIYIGNGFGKLTGYPQVEELGNIETPVVLTNTLSVPVAARSMFGMARTGGNASNGSGDFAIAVSTAEDIRIPYLSDSMFEESRVLRNDRLDILFEAVIEATEEAIINSLFAAETVTGKGKVKVESLPVEKTLEILRKYNRIK